MKKIFLSALLIGNLLFAHAAQYNVHMESEGSRPTNRSFTSTPKVSYESNSGELSVRFDEQNEHFTVIVLDSAGRQIFQAMVTADGTMQSHFLPNLEKGTYTIALEGESISYKGTLVLSPVI